MRAGEDPRVSLEAGCAYLATLDVSGVVLRLYPRTSRVSNPTVSQVSTEGEAGSTWEVRNTYDGSYGIKFTNVTRGRAVVMKMVVAGSDTVTLT